jgi:oxygen-independent coproporphyrinogen-3 oxidase
MVATARANEREAHGAAESWSGGPRWRDDEPRVELAPARVFAAGLRHHHLSNTAYPIAHRKTIWRHRVDGDEQAALLARTFAAIGSMSVYLHVPFCERRCRFCEYCVVPEDGADLQAAYVEAVLGELALYRNLIGAGRELAGFDIGGGTPTSLPAPAIARLVAGVQSMFHAAPGLDPSIETTPRIAARSPEKIRALRAMGIERISMGLQMANPRLLREYGRDLNEVDDNRRAMEVMRAACKIMVCDIGLWRQSAAQQILSKPIWMPLADATSFAASCRSL